jgi:murein DD-endopeptidase MepM/ murein hydrolase activator NlpD
VLAELLVAGALHVAAQSRATRPGELVVLTIDAPAAVAAVRVHAFDRDIPSARLAGGRWQALVGVDLETRPGTYPVRVSAAGDEAVTYDLVVRPRQFRTRRLTVDPDFVTPPPSARERIERDAALLNGVWRASPPERLWTTAFVRPVPHDANSAFGTRSVFNGKPLNAHSGADFLSPAGTPIHAPNAGRVVVARDLYYSGNTVVIDHGQGLFSTLAHLSAFEVHEGESVAAGQTIGLVGATGRVTGPHLHWAIRVNGARVDPLSVLDLLGATPARPTARVSYRPASVATADTR